MTKLLKCDENGVPNLIQEITVGWDDNGIFKIKKHTINFKLFDESVICFNKFHFCNATGLDKALADIEDPNFINEPRVIEYILEKHFPRPEYKVHE